jgi:hypothetical protein
MKKYIKQDELEILMLNNADLVSNLDGAFKMLQKLNPSKWDAKKERQAYCLIFNAIQSVKE